LSDGQTGVIPGQKSSSWKLRATEVDATIGFCPLEISRNFLKSVEWAACHPSYTQERTSAHNRSQGEKVMQFALLIFEPPEAFAARNADENDPYLGAWRAYHKALIEADIFVGGSPLLPPETGTTVRLKDGKRRVQDGPFADTKEQLGGFTILELPSLDAALEWAARCPAASIGAVEVRPVSPEYLRRVTG
jgi:hypothetical protein